MEWLHRGTYLVDPPHPPLARIFVASLLYLAGLRSPQIPPQPNGGGSQLLRPRESDPLRGGHYRRNLSLARMGILPFFLVGVWVVSRWTRREYGPVAGLLAAFAFTILPGILTFAGVAYTDFPAAITQLVLI
jgi:hypothetical protein